MPLNSSKVGKDFVSLQFTASTSYFKSNDTPGVPVSAALAVEYNDKGPQTGSMGRNNPQHFMTFTGLDVVHRRAGFPHGVGFADDVIHMPLQCSTQWDGLGVGNLT